MRRVATFICQEKVILEGLKPFGNFEAINLSGFFYILLLSCIVNISNVWGFFLVKHIGDV